MTSQVLVQTQQEKFESEPVKNISTVTKTPIKHTDSSEKCTADNSIESSAPILDPYRKINQLELNIRSLQAQHLIMLTSLHDEIESLRLQNKDLQFQLVFKTSSPPSKSGVNSEDYPAPYKTNKASKSHSENSGENSKDGECLEHKLSTTLTSLEEATAKNSRLTAMIEDQKLQIAQLSKKPDKASKREQMNNEFRTIESQLKDELKSCLLQLEDAERLIQILRKENDEQQSEIKMLKSTSNKGNYSGRKNNRNHYQSSHRFPPLAHWQPQNKPNNGEWSSGRGSQVARNSSRGFLSSAESLDHQGYHVAVSLPHVQSYNGQNNYHPNGNHHSYNHNRRGNQRNDDRNQNLHAQGYRKHLNGSRGMSQESN